MTGLGFDIHDSRSLHKISESAGDNERQEKAEDEQFSVKYTSINPSLKDVGCFAFCYIGSLTG